jgi:RNA polymerase sigma-70 factor (ECF subfamily)
MDSPGGLDRLWLFGVASRLIANEKRADTRRDRLRGRLSNDAVAPQQVADHADTVINRVRVREALESLPARDREDLRLIEWDGLNISEAATVSGCSQAALRVRLHRARRKLIEQLADTQRNHGNSEE